MVKNELSIRPRITEQNHVIIAQDAVRLVKTNPSNNMKKYRIKEWKDAPVYIRHIWQVQKRRHIFFWRTINLFKTYQEAEEYINKLMGK